MTPLFLTQSEVDDLCAPLKQPAAQLRYLRSLGLKVTEKPNGRAAVVRSHAEQVLGTVPVPAAAAAPATHPAATSSAPQPDRGALIEMFKGRGGANQHGPQAHAQPA